MSYFPRTFFPEKFFAAPYWGESGGPLQTPPYLEERSEFGIVDTGHGLDEAVLFPPGAQVGGPVQVLTSQLASTRHWATMSFGTPLVGGNFPPSEEYTLRREP